jgi:hypothetical protein
MKAVISFDKHSPFARDAGDAAPSETTTSDRPREQQSYGLTGPAREGTGKDFEMRKVTLSPAVHGPAGDLLQIYAQIDFPDTTG